MESDIKNLFTLVIFTYNRPNHLKRLLSYYFQEKSTFTIFIADSSDDENKKSNKEIIDSYPTLNSKHFSHFTSDTFFWFKAYEILSYVQTSYSLIVADDDFVIPRAIAQSINFLENNFDYVVAQGIYYGFMFKERAKKPEFFVMNPHGYRSIIHQDAINRVKDVVTNYTTLCYGVFRTKDFVALVRGVNTWTQHYKFSEYLLNALIAVHGKTKVLYIPYYARELSFSSLGVAFDTDWLVRADFKESCQFFEKGLTDYLVTKNVIKIDEAQRVAQEVRILLINYQYEILRRATIDSPSLFKSIVRFCLPAQLLKKAKGLKHYFFQDIPQLFLLKKLASGVYEKSSSNPFYNDLQKILHVIADSKIMCQRSSYGGLLKIDI